MFLKNQKHAFVHFVLDLSEIITRGSQDVTVTWVPQSIDGPVKETKYEVGGGGGGWGFSRK